jgi:uncharacterized protein YqjF (DUF2071 family)
VRSPRETPDGIAALTALLQRPGATTTELADAAGLAVEDAARTLGALALDGDVDVAAGRFRVSEEGLARFEAHVRRLAHAIGEPDAEGPLEHCPTFPLPMRTTWQEAICWNWRVDPERLRAHVPSCLEVEVAHGRAWVTVAMSRLDDMRPAYLPPGAGWNFYQISHRAHVRYTDYRGEVRRGCYFIRSYTNSPLMNAIGNQLPEFKFHVFRDATMTMIRDGSTLLASVEPEDAGKLVSVLDESKADRALPPTSLWRDVDEAFPLLVEAYDAYGWEPEERMLYILTIDRGAWEVSVPRVQSVYDGVLSEVLFDEASAELDSVFTIKGVPYRWKPLRREKIA